MESTYKCPFCAVAYHSEANMRVHLEVEHRKSELVEFVVDRDDRRTEPRVKLAP